MRASPVSLAVVVFLASVAPSALNASPPLRSAGTANVRLSLRNFPATASSNAAAAGRRFFVHAAAVAQLEQGGRVTVRINRIGGDSSVDLAAGGCSISNEAVRTATSEEMVRSELSCEIEVPNRITLAADATVAKGSTVQVILEATPVLE